METPIVEQRLRQIVAKIAETTPDFSPTASFRNELDIDSVRALEVVFEIERTLGVHVPEARYGEVRSFNDLLALVASLKK